MLAILLLREQVEICNCNESINEDKTEWPDAFKEILPGQQETVEDLRIFSRRIVYIAPNDALCALPKTVFCVAPTSV